MKVTDNGIDIIKFDDVMIVDDSNIEESLLHDNNQNNTRAYTRINCSSQINLYVMNYKQ